MRGKRNRKAYLLLMVSLLLGGMMTFTSCEIETSDNGDFDGFWHLESIDSLATGNKADYTHRRTFWGVENKLIYAYDADSLINYYCRFTQTADSVVITKVYLDHGHQDNGIDGGDIPVEVVNDSLRYYGINALPEGFLKEKLNGSKMVLKSKTLRLNFRRF